MGSYNLPRGPGLPGPGTDARLHLELLGAGTPWTSASASRFLECSRERSSQVLCRLALWGLAERAPILPRPPSGPTVEYTLKRAATAPEQKP